MLKCYDIMPFFVLFCLRVRVCVYNKEEGTYRLLAHTTREYGLEF